MGDLLMLIVMVIAAVGVAALILMLSEAILITLPEMLIRAVKGNSAASVQARPPLTGQRSPKLRLPVRQ